jgi:hypothetical protein
MPRVPSFELLRSCLIPVALAVVLPSQNVLVVGAGGFSSIQDAVAAAAPGDRVHVQSGTWYGFTCNKPLVVRALGPVTLGTSILQPGHVTLAPPAGQTVHLVGFELMRLTLTSGSATVENCTISMGAGVQNARLHLQDSIVHGSPGLDAIGAAVTATSCYFPGAALFFSDGPIVRLSGSVLHGSNLHIGGTWFSTTGTLLRANAASTAWITDSAFTGAAPNHCAFAIDGSSSVRVARTSLPSASTGCAAPTPASLLGVERTSPLLVGQPFTVSWSTEPNGFVAVFASHRLGQTSWAPLLEQPSWLDDQHSFALTLLLADAHGDAAATFAIPSGPGIADQELWFKGISGLSLPLQASAPVGGIAR